MLYTPLHLFHELEHLLRREAGDCFGYRLRGRFGGDGRTVEGRLEMGRGGEMGRGKEGRCDHVCRSMQKVVHAYVITASFPCGPLLQDYANISIGYM